RWRPCNEYSLGQAAAAEPRPEGCLAALTETKTINFAARADGRRRFEDTALARWTGVPALDRWNRALLRYQEQPLAIAPARSECRDGGDPAVAPIKDDGSPRRGRLPDSWAGVGNDLELPQL